MNIIIRATTLASVALLAACGGETDHATHESVGSDREAIIGGASTTLFPEVGIIGTADPNMMCSGTLVAPNIVLTAGHCVHAGAAYGFYTGAGSTFTGQNVTQATLDGLGNTTKHAVLESVTYPQAIFSTSPYQNDVAYVRLATPIFDITPAKFGPLPAVGTSCTVVGFGMVSLTSPTGLYKKSGTVSVASIGNTINVSRVDSSQYHGDSGGPMYCGGLQVGVFSWIDDTTSATATRREARIDGAVATWIQSILALYPAPQPADAGEGASDAAAPTPDGGAEADAAPDAAAPGSALPTGQSSGGSAPAAGAPSSSATSEEAPAAASCSVGNRRSGGPSSFAAAGLALALALALGRRATKRSNRAPR